MWLYLVPVADMSLPSVIWAPGAAHEADSFVLKRTVILNEPACLDGQAQLLILSGRCKAEKYFIYK